MADDPKHLERQVRELEAYLDGLAHGGRIGHTSPTGRRRADDVDEEIAQTKREIEALEKRLATSK